MELPQLAAHLLFPPSYLRPVSTTYEAHLHRSDIKFPTEPTPRGRNGVPPLLSLFLPSSLLLTSQLPCLAHETKRASPHRSPPPPTAVSEALASRSQTAPIPSRPGVDCPRHTAPLATCYDVRGNGAKSGGRPCTQDGVGSKGLARFIPTYLVRPDKYACTRISDRGLEGRGFGPGAGLPQHRGSHGLAVPTWLLYRDLPCEDGSTPSAG